MHIPDGYLSPQTYVPAYAVIIPIWGVASRRLKQTMKQRQVPMLALAAAFSFVIMMFNVPIPGGTTGHAVGAVLIAVLLGPWAATIAVSLALIVQALLFGDGGITAIGANCLNMAVVMPWIGWGAYRLAAGSSSIKSRRRWIAAAVGGYAGLNAAAVTTGIMFGIQPIIAHGADGHALYNPFGLSVAVPAMAIEHLLVFGFVEAAVTGFVVSYLQRTDPSMLAAFGGSHMESAPTDVKRSPIVQRLAIALAGLAVLSPLGLYLPAKFAAGTAWGEWSSGEIGKLAGYVPKQLDKVGSIWHAPIADYSLPGQESASLTTLSFSYVLSALVGIGLLVLVVYLCRRLYTQVKK